MARGLGLAAWVGAAMIAGSSAAPPIAKGDDTKGAAKPGVEAKTAFTRLKSLAGGKKVMTTSFLLTRQSHSIPAHQPVPAKAAAND